MKSDGEHSIVALKKKAAQIAEIEAIPKESPVGESRSNGEIEVAVKEVKGLMRSVKSDLEHKLKIEIDRKRLMLRMLSRDIGWGQMVAQLKSVGPGRTGGDLYFSLVS